MTQFKVTVAKYWDGDYNFTLCRVKPPMFIAPMLERQLNRDSKLQEKFKNLLLLAEISDTLLINNDWHKTIQVLVDENLELI